MNCSGIFEDRKVRAFLFFFNGVGVRVGAGIGLTFHTHEALIAACCS